MPLITTCWFTAIVSELASDSAPPERLTIRATNEGLRVSAVMPFNEGWMVWLHDT